MNHPALVGVGERLGDPRDHGDRRRGVERTLLESRFQGLSGEQFHREVRNALVLAVPEQPQFQVTLSNRIR